MPILEKNVPCFFLHCLTACFLQTEGLSKSLEAQKNTRHEKTSKKLLIKYFQVVVQKTPAGVSVREYEGGCKQILGVPERKKY